MNSRYRAILAMLSEQSGNYIKSITFARELSVSTKTIQNDIHNLRDILDEQYTGAVIESMTGKGYRIKIVNNQKYEDYLLEAYSDNNERSTRLRQIMSILLCRKKRITLDWLADEVFISKSRVISDLNIVKNQLAKYNLEIVNNAKTGITLKGSERNKRLCIIKENILINQESLLINEANMISTVSEVMINVLVEYQYNISDRVFQNLVIHVVTAIKRMYQNHYINDEITIENVTLHHTLKIAQDIMSEVSRIYNIIPSVHEINYLAVNLEGKRNYDNDEIVSKEIDEFVSEMLVYIHSKVNIDFSFDIDFRISLALHLIPLITRLKNKMQLTNIMKEEIRNNFAFAYDNATIASHYIYQKTGFKLSDDEISYLAIHFNVAIENISTQIEPKKVLLICSSRSGDKLLLRQKFYKWFKDYISTFKVINVVEIENINLNEFDVIFTTVFDQENIPTDAIKINYFLDDSDRKIIEQTFENGKLTRELIGYFDRDLLYTGEVSTKDEIIKILCNRANSKYTFTENLYESVLSREALGYTSFGNLIAIPHPEGVISNKTFVAIGLLEKPIQWAEDQHVQIVLLACVEENSENDLKLLFDGISRLVLNREAVDSILGNPNYENFVSILEKILEY